MKHEWRKKEKGIYLPKNKPEMLDIPKFKFLTINGDMQYVLYWNNEKEHN